MNFTVSWKYDLNKSTDCIIIGVFELNIVSQIVRFIGFNNYDYLCNILKNGDFKGKIGQTLILYNIPKNNIQRILLIGCGKKFTINLLEYQKIVSVCIKKILSVTAHNIIIFLLYLDVLNLNIYWKVRHFIEYFNDFIQEYEIKKFQRCYNNKKYYKNIILKINNISLNKKATLAIKHANAISKGIAETKNLCNLPPNLCNAKYLSEQAKYLESKYPEFLKTKIINKTDMYKLNMHAYLSVSYGSANKPYMSIIKYFNKNTSNDSPLIVLVGKGVTFDSGGISIKPSKNLDQMKYDMSGAATIYGVMTSLSELKLPVNVIGILAGCDNIIGKNSYCPGDIITTMSGKKVEILNTDAEGRLILCDVLTYVQKFNPSVVIDIATLTGACVIALGDVYTGLMSNNDKLAKDLIISGNSSGDLVWRLPLHKKYENDLKSIFADINNSDKGYAGASVAACFLSKFIKKYHWAHLDIAGTAWLSRINGGSTGRPNKLLCEYLLRKSNIHR